MCFITYPTAPKQGYLIILLSYDSRKERTGFTDNVQMLIYLAKSGVHPNVAIEGAPGRPEPFLLIIHLFFFPAILFFFTYFVLYFAHYLAIFLLIKGFSGVSPAFEHAWLLY